MKTYFTKTYISNKQGAIAKAKVFYNDDHQALLELLQENQEQDALFNPRPSSEFFNVLQFTSCMLAAFPVGIFMRRSIRKNKKLHNMLQLKEIRQVRTTIEKGSFAYDTLLFKQSPLQLIKNKTHLANLVCLAILFGDEFIDGVATVYGKENIRAILNDDQLNYYLRYKNTNNGFTLYYQFDICDVLPQEVLAASNEKYNITYKTFNSHLQFLLQEMNKCLSKLDEEKAEAAAQLICRACNKCFDTYKADINEFDENYTLADLLRYQKTKDDDIIQVLLTLRAVLIDKKQLQYQKQFGSWSSMVRSMQLYDDMQDVAGDCDFQMNTLCYFAKNYFSTEWQWLQQHKTKLQKMCGLQLHSTISLNMPASCILTMQYARNIAHTKLSWVQRKIQNYLWRKNWLGFNNPLLNEKGFCLSAIMNKEHQSIPLKLHFIQKKVMAIESIFITEEMKWAHIIDIALMDEALKKYVFKKIGRRQKYFLTNSFIEFPVAQKAALAKKIVTYN